MPTKPVIQYVGAKNSTNIEPFAIVRKKIDKTTYINWMDKTEFTDFVDLLYVHPRSDTYVYVVCGCGLEYIYTTKVDVPASDVTCSCGRKIIEYGV